MHHGMKFKTRLGVRDVKLALKLPCSSFSLPGGSSPSSLRVIKTHGLLSRLPGSRVGATCHNVSIECSTPRRCLPTQSSLGRQQFDHRWSSLLASIPRRGSYETLEFDSFDQSTYQSILGEEVAQLRHYVCHSLYRCGSSGGAVSVFSTQHPN
jgi:hypothetical protein